MFQIRRSHPRLEILHLLVVSFLLLFPACSGKSSGTAPPELVGTWTAQGPPYSGRTLEIQALRLYFGTGESDAPEPLSIVQVRWEEAEDYTLYTIDYESSGGDEFTLPVQLDPRSRELRLANRDQVVWKLRMPTGAASRDST